jgi:sirohydrochlorin cobaltochelatase
MKKIKFLMIAMMAIMATATFTACSDDDDNQSNMERYQKEVDKAVNKQKKNDKAILLVAFGSTWQQAYDAFDLTRREYAKEFSGYDVYLSFSSAICINRARAAENTAARDFYEPKYWLEAFGRAQYSEIIVQSMQVIPGEEYGRVVNAVKDFANNVNGDIDDKYLSEVTIKIGLPLMAKEGDAKILADELDKNFSKYANKGAMLFMGHGNPDEYDTYKANVRYTQLENYLQTINPNYFVGTVDMKENFKTQVRDRMETAGITSGNVYCAPLMSIAGDHAHNDMAGDDDAWEEGVGYEVNEEGEVEDTSWKCYFGNMGYDIDAETYTDDKGIVKGLLEYKNIRDIYIQHTKDAEVVDYYHSMYPEE